MRFAGCTQLLVLIALMGGPQSLYAQQFRVFIGTYTNGDSESEGIYSCVLDAADGTLTEPVLSAEAINPSFLAIHPNGNSLYCVNEVSEGPGRGTGRVTAFSIDSASGALERINGQSSLGGAPCHCNVDATGKWLLVANYVGGNVAVFPIGSDGALSQSSSNVQHTGSSINEQRQEGPHAHSINLSADNAFAYVADLGLDKILIYRFDAQEGVIAPNSPYAVAVTPGGGPRHFSIHPNGKFAYTNNELTAVVTVFSRDAENGGLTPVQELSSLRLDYEGSKGTAECVVHPTGKFLYVSNRGHDSIAAFRIDENTGMLTQIEFEPSGGKVPRNFCIDPTGKWLLAANQASDSIVVFSVDLKTGELEPTGTEISVARPVCIRMAMMPEESDE
jgi:6-phosphogluconolactonase